MGCVETRTFNREKLLAELNEQASRRMGVSFEELVRLDRDGKLEDRSAVSDLLMFVHLFPSTDPIRKCA
jgi:hypothetical protein